MMFPKHPAIVSWFALIFFAASLASAASALVDQGKAAGRIVTPAKATPGETFAAQEIQDYIQRITAARLPIVASDDAGSTPAIIIGRHPANAAVAAELAKRHPGSIDAFAVVGDGEQLHLVGRSETSTIWAAWQWLNDQGVRWLMPGPHGVYVPKSANIEIKSITDIQAPGAALRGSYVVRAPDKGGPAENFTLEHGWPAWKLFALRMRMNYNLGFNNTKDRYWVFGSGHSYRVYMPPSRYFKQHPEWYNLINGKRQNGPGWQLCFTNQDAAAQFAKNAMAEMKKALDQGVPLDRMIMAVSPNDGRAMCECPNCRKLVDKNGSATSLVVNFANMVAADIHKVYPKARIVFYAYDNYSTPPDHVKPAPNVCPIVTAWTAAQSFAVNHAHPLFSQANHKYRDSFAAWSNLSDALGAYTYYGHYSWFTPWPMTTQIVRDIPAMSRDPKFFGLYSETHAHWGTQGLTFWLFPKLLWNPNLDVKAAVKDYCQAAYGPAADAMEAYYKTLQDSMDRQGYIVGDIREIPQVLTPDVISRCNALIDQAADKLDQMDPDMRWRTELAVESWRHSAQFAEATRLFTRSNRPEDRLKILALCDKVETFADTDMGKWAYENDIVKAGLRQIVSGLKLDLAELPVGKHTYSGNLMYGGAIKFFARISGFRKGLWGYALPVNGQGEIDVPLRAAPGHRIASAHIKWSIPRPERFAGTLTAISEKGQETVLTTDVRQMTRGVDLPSNPSGQTIRLRLHLLNQYHEDTIALTGCRIQVEVR